MRKFVLINILILHVAAREDVAPTPGKDLPSTAKLQIEVLTPPDKVCKGKAENSNTVKVHYTGWSLATGKEFDSSHKRNQPLGFKLGVGNVIKGWDQGVKGMCIGEKRRLTIPSGLAYGDRGFPPLIAPGATLVFDVELVGNDAAKEEL